MEKRSEEILELLQSKNRCLDRLMLATRTFLSTTLEEIVTESVTMANPLSMYEEARTAIIRTLELHDRKIGALIDCLEASAKTPEFLDEVRAEMRKNERLIVSVFNADDIVFRKIGDAQSQIIKLMHENRKSRDILGRFKSAQAQTGEGMDKTL